jgi:hypothetical protein
MSDQDVIKQCAELLDSASARILFPKSDSSDVPIDDELAALIRKKVEIALAETIYEDGNVK